MINHFDMQLTQKQVKKYKKATKKEKGEIITRYCELTGVSRNLASKRFIKAIKNPYLRVLKIKRSKKKKGRKPKYTNVHKAIIKKAWQLSGEICGERLYPIINEYIKQLGENGELKRFDKNSISETVDISERTLKRIIAEFPKTKNHRKNKGNVAIYKAIPIKAHFGENSDKPGYIEIDYVEHSGGNSSGTFSITGSYVDVCLGWIARNAGLGKSLSSVTAIHDENQKKIFHKVYEYHPDNAKPILKLLLERKLSPNKRKKPRYSISRSRPYHKEDNGHVEQKNGDKVRKLVGYHRYDTEEQTELLNRLYQVEDLISNFFLPSQKLVRKIKDEKGRAVSKKHDRAKTAYQRFIDSEQIDDKIKKKLTKIFKNLNLVALRKRSEELQNALFQTVLSRKNILA